jgi:hypothetical protein
VGQCSEWGGTALEPWLAQHGIADVVRVLPSVPPAELTKLVAASNVLLNFAQGQPRQIPAKSYEYIASGREVLTIAETSSDVADLFREAGVGTIVEPDDRDGMARSIRRFYDRFVAQRRTVEVNEARTRFSRSSQLMKFEQTINDTLLSVG